MVAQSLPHVELILAGDSIPILVFSGHKQVAFENIAPRHQLATHGHDPASIFFVADCNCEPNGSVGFFSGSFLLNIKRN